MKAFNVNYENIQYERRRPETTILHRVIRENFVSTLDKIESVHSEGSGGCSSFSFPYYVRNEFLKFLDCGILSKGFLLLRCPQCNACKLVGHSCKCRGLCPVCGTRRMANTAANLVDDVIPQGQVRQWVLSLPFQIRFILAYNSEVLTSLLGIYVRAVSSYYILTAKKMGIKTTKTTPLQTAAVTFVQRFGSLNLNVHFHTLFSDGVFYTNKKEVVVFKKTRAPSTAEVEKINKKIIKRFIRALTKRGFLGDDYNGNRQFEDQGEAPNQIMSATMASSLSSKIGWGPRRGGKIERIGQTSEVAWKPKQGARLSYIGGFSLHANVMVKASDRSGLEQLCRYVARPALANSRISEDGQGNIIYELKNKYSDGTTHLKFSVEEFIEKLVALIPPPRVHLVRYHGLLAPNCKNRAKVVPGGAYVEESKKIDEEALPKKKYWINWSELFKRIFKKDALICEKCGNTMKIVADIIDPDVIKRILKSMNLEDSDYTINESSRYSSPLYYQSD